MKPLQGIAIRLALETAALDVIAEKKGEHVTAAEIAKTTGYDALLIGQCCHLTSVFAYLKAFRAHRTTCDVVRRCQ